MSRKQARIERKNLKKLKQDQKSVRLRTLPDAEEPRVGSYPKRGKSVRLGADPGSIFHMPMTWSCEAPDCEGAWSWGVPRQWTEATWRNDIRPKLEQWAQLRWSEIDSMSSDTGHKMHHLMKVDQICDEAQLRLMEIEQEGEEIFRFRLGNLQRLWGFRVVADFEVLWYDPTHQIYPVG
ncbi:hypothetical protein [Roseospira navarrensis]|uniref:Uncharacterized protein n=1 Tax=Roseospira navarrensis TaxID=140058 RepID=A0A7X1ZIK8_9PROT|nr:hypothetical protein [Roseospira navarrensis]MQX38117.1 hypothetical protein [Roseospira navarrensis]